MKRFFVLAAFVAPMFITSCNSSEIQRLQQENDSLKSVAITGGVKIDDFLAAFNSIQENLNDIKEKEQIISLKANNGEVSGSSAEQINDDITAIYELMLKNKQTIKDLNTKLNSSGLKNKELAKTIQLLTEQMESKDKEVATLKDQLEHMNLIVEDLDAKVAAMDSTIMEQQQVNEEQNALISSQDAALNTVYYALGTKKELINHGVVSKDGMFKGLKIGDSFDKNYFTQVDLRSLSSITLNVKKATILSSHPTSSYKLVERGNMVEKIEITDPVAFWERSKFLVIVTD